jgi:hypothetical protein
MRVTEILGSRRSDGRIRWHVVMIVTRAGPTEMSTSAEPFPVLPFHTIGSICGVPQGVAIALFRYALDRKRG